MPERRTCSGINRVFLLMLFNMTVVPSFLGRLFLQTDLYTGTAATVFFYALPVLLYVKITRGRCLEDIPFAAPRLSTVLLVFLFVLLLLPIVVWINMFSMMFSENHAAAEMMEAEGQSFWKNVFFIAFIPAAAEEFVVRGVLYHGYRKAGVLKGAVLSGFLFGIMHLNINQFCYAAVLGIVFALLVEACGNLFYSMEAHFLINLSSVLLLNVRAMGGQGMFFAEKMRAGRNVILAARALAERSAGMTARTLSGRSVEMTAWTLAGRSVEMTARDELLLAWTFCSALAVVCIVLARMVFIWIARHSHRWEHMQAVFRGEEQESVAGKYRAVTPSLIIAVLFGIACMFRAEIM